MHENVVKLGRKLSKVVFRRKFTQKSGLSKTKTCNDGERIHEIVVKLKINRLQQN